jgi:DNA-binding LacI/PurR family transcriptional regulator
MKCRSYTVREIAAQAGVSKSTVSLALRNDPRIGPETRDRVQAVCRRLGHRPNPLVAALLSHKRATRAAPFGGVIALVSNWSKPKDNWHYAGAQARSEELGYSLVTVRLREMSATRLETMLVARGIFGLVLLPLQEPQHTLPIAWDRFASVAIGFSLTEPALDRVYFDHLRAANDTFPRLLARGYRRVGLMLTHDQDERSRHCWSYVLAHFQASRLARERVAPLIAPALDAGLVKTWLEREQPDVVLGMQEEPMRLMLESGWRVPHDAGYVSLYLTSSARKAGAAGWDSDFDSIGAAAIDLVTSRLQRNERGVPERPQLMLVSPHWVDGRTLRAPRDGAL